MIEYIKYSKDKEKLSRILKDNSRMLIDREAALVIKTITNTADRDFRKRGEDRHV